MASGAEWREGYTDLKDLRICLDRVDVSPERGFFVSLWLYISRSGSSCAAPSVILRQVAEGSEGEAPFLALDEHNKLIIFPLVFLHEEAPSLGISSPWADLVHLASDLVCPFEKWIHIGCEVAVDCVRLHVNGTLISGKPLSADSALYKESWKQNDIKRISLIGNIENEGKFDGYAYDIQVLPITASIKDQIVKNLPVKLSIDDSSLPDGVEVSSDGVWCIVGGKVLCCRIFTMEVVLLDAMSQLVDKEIEIVASLAYSENGMAVEKCRDDTKAPLLIIDDGRAFRSTDRPVTLLLGRATFQLQISQLSSKSNNKLFRICFRTTDAKKYPFLEAFSHPIRSVSRSRGRWTPSFGRRVASIAQLHEIHSVEDNDGTQSNDCSEYSLFSKLNTKEFECAPLSKGWKAENGSLQPLHPNGLVGKDENVRATASALKLRNIERTERVPSDSKSTDFSNKDLQLSGKNLNPISDRVLFKFCLDGIHERSLLLKEIVPSVSDDDMAYFADQVCINAGCSHHWYQIMMSRQLVQQGNDAWLSISTNKDRALWEEAVPEINRRFMAIAHSPNRGLSGQDLEVLRGITGCLDELGRDHFDRMWSWLYPIANTLSEDPMGAMWRCTSPRWIEGLITRDEAEESFGVPGALQAPAGTFVLRFPTSRSWPHPDAGRLVVTFVGSDSTIHHKLLSVDRREMSSEQLQDILFKEPELVRLGRIRRRR